MKRRIFLSMCALALTSVLLSSTLVVAVLYPLFQSQMQQELQSKMQYITTALNQIVVKDQYLRTNEILNNRTRISLIAQDGTVLFDNRAQADDMDNHLSRPEIAAAFQDGFGQSVRLSSTLGSQTFYYAALLNDGTVIRLADTTASVFYTFAGILPLMIAFAAVVFILAMYLAKKMTARIITPINKIDLENPAAYSGYEELSPLLHRIKKQNQQINRQMAELRARQEDFAAITSHMSEGLIVLDDKENILTVNPSAIHLLKAAKASYEGRHLLSLSRNLTLLRAAEAALAGRHCNEELNFRNKICQLFASPVYDNKAVKGAILLVLDITEQHKAEKIRREFSANVSHELKTPLTSISGYAELLKDGMVKTKDIPEFAERIHSEATRLITLVEAVIKLSGLDEGKEHLPLEEIDLLELSGLIAARLQPQAADNNIHITIQGESVKILAVKQMLDELIFNLCENAIKYNKPDGKVQIRIFRDNGKSCLSVTDTGIGISQEHQDRVFERFYRVDKSHSKQTGGTGLGLSIVKHIAEYHNAEIKLVSTKNLGTEIAVIFPQSPEHLL